MPKADAEVAHESVLLRETVDALQVGGGGLFVDATVGAGGHSEAILKANSNVTVVGLDQDESALELAKTRLNRFGDRFVAIHSNFADIIAALSHVPIPKRGIVADLGVSSMQFDSETRGFSFRFDAPLDMRMDAGMGETAADLLERLDEEELANIIYTYGEERASRRIARWIVEKRNAGQPITTTFELAALVKRAVPPSRKDAIHPATRTFQALRIVVNRELEALEKFIEDAVTVLDGGGRLAIITFHSLEDRIVKQAFQRLSGKCQCPPRIPQCVCGAEKKIEIVTKKPITPSESEQKRNPRSRSAKLRVAQKVTQV